MSCALAIGALGIIMSIEEQRKRDFIKTTQLSGWFDEKGLELIRQTLKVKD